MSSTRSNRRPQAHQVSLNNVESLLLAQAVWELGAGTNSWIPISKILAKHPLVTRPKAFFSPQACHVMYETLMKEAGLEMNESNNVPHAPVNLQLARKHYRSRFLELQSLILAEESKFKTVLKEIEDIKSGVLENDDQTRSKGSIESTRQSPSTKSIESAEDFVGKVDPEPADLEKKSSEPNATFGDKVDSEGKLEEGNQIEAAEHAGENAKESPLGSNLLGGNLSTTRSSPTNDSEDLVDENAILEGTTEEERAEEIEILETTSALKEGEGEGEALADHREEEEEEEAEVQNGDNTDTLAYEEQKVDQTSVMHAQAQSDRSADQMSPAPIEESLLRTIRESKDIPKAASHSEEEETDLPEQMDIDIESELANTPAAHVVGSEDAEKSMEKENLSDTEEPIMQTRRSSRRRKSSAASIPPPQARKRLRSKARLAEIEPQVIVDSDNDNDNDIDIEIDEKEDTPAIEDERASSPYEGVTTRRRDGKRKASFLEPNDSSPDKKRIREDSEPVDEDGAGSSSHTRTRSTRHTTKTEEQVALKRFQNVIGMLHSQISQHRNGNIFHNPIKNSDAPDYHEIVKRPMDLKTIKTRVKDGVIANSLEYQRDIYLMFANAMMYNRPGSDVHAMAEDMMVESEGQINAFRQTEGLVKRGQRP